jgi:hypothetical protein
VTELEHIEPLAADPDDADDGADEGELGRLPRKHKSDRRFWGGDHWHAMDVRFYPAERSRFEGDLGRLIRDEILPGHTPEAPLLEAGDSVVTLGSCFARELRDHLTRLGFSSGNFWIPSGLNNTFAILDFIAWCVTGSDSGQGFRYDRFDDGKIREWTPGDEREQYQARLAEAGAFVFTFGLAEVWEDRETGGVFWRGIPSAIFDAERHNFRLTTVEENEENIVRLVELIRSVNPAAPIVLTLSPVPLRATFSGRSCVTADSVSKSVLRVAIDRVESRGLPGVYYWPSFEVVRWAGAHLPWPAYGIPDRRARHVSRYLVSEIMEAFIQSFYTPAAVAQMNRSRSREPAPRSLRGRASDAAYPLGLWVGKRLERARKSETTRLALENGKQLRKRGRRTARRFAGIVRGVF